MKTKVSFNPGLLELRLGQLLIGLQDIVFPVFFFFLFSFFSLFSTFQETHDPSPFTHFLALESCRHHFTVTRGSWDVDAWSREAKRCKVDGGEEEDRLTVPSFLARFLVIQPLDHHHSTWNQLPSSSGFQPYTNRPLKVAKKIHHFSWNLSFETWFWPIGGEFEGNNSILLIVAKNPSIWYIYILLMFSNVLKITLFEVKLSIKVVSFYMQDQPGLNQNSRPHLDLFWCHKFIGGLRFSKRATVGKLIVWGKLFCTISRAIMVYVFSGLRFGNRSHPQTLLD